MANEYRLSFTAEEIDEKLNKVDNLTWSDVGNNKDGTVTQLDNKYLAILNHTEASETDILAEQDITFTYVEEFGLSNVGLQVDTTEFVENEVYTVSWDGTEHQCVAYIPDVEGITDVVIGNMATGGMTPDTGEPFLAIITLMDGAYYLTINANDTADTNHTVRIYQSTEETYAIKNEYLSILDYTEGEKVDIYPEQTLAFSYNSNFGAYVHSILSNIPFELVEGEEYNIIWDGVDDKRAAFAFTSADSSECVAVGNTLAAGGEDNGDKFAIVYDSTHGYLQFLSLETTDTHTVSIYQKTDDKYTVKEEHLPFDAIKAYIDNYINEALGGDY